MDIVDPVKVYIDHKTTAMVDNVRKTLPNLDILKAKFMKILIEKEDISLIS
jgi:hypothetical protein